MMRLGLLGRGPILMGIFPFTRNDDLYDRPVNEISKPLGDELGWDRVKNIFRLTQDGLFTKELQSIVNITMSGFVLGVAVGGASASKNTVHNFISNNEATRFINPLDAKRNLQTAVSISFIKNGGKMGTKLGFFCFLFSTLTTCTTAYRGKMAVGNYVLGSSITGLLFKINLGLRAALVGAGVGGVLGGLCGALSIAVLKLSNADLDEVIIAQQRWLKSRNEHLRKKIKESMFNELPEVKETYEENLKFRALEQKKTEVSDK